MSAHSKPLNLETTCDDRACGARATDEVFNTHNAPQGKFCPRHARILLKELRNGEAKR